MTTQKNLPYSIGLDIGTNSVGYAVVDDNGEVLRFNGKNMLGVRLFDEGQTAVERRILRSTRRRKNRRKNRIALLRDLIGGEVLAKDLEFFKRFDESYLLQEDKTNGDRNILFTDKSYTDVDYHKQFPTIYHLRKHLIQSNKKADVRLVYLALHHILKSRGHFLNGTKDFTVGEGLEKATVEFVKEADDFYEFTPPANLSGDIVKILKEKTSKADKQDQLKKLVPFEKTQKVNKAGFEQTIKAILGYKADYCKVFKTTDTGKGKLSFSLNEDIEDKLDELENIALDNFILFEKISQVYSAFILDQLLKGKNYISDAMVLQYEKHKKELKSLKRLYKKYFSAAERKAVFSNKTGTYEEYIRHSGKKINNKPIYEVLQKNIKEALKAKAKSSPALEKEEDYQLCLKALEEGEFLKKLRTRDNVSLPHQVHKMELEEILKRQGQYYPALEQHHDKIICILTFRIPYYVGPLNPHSDFSWAIRKQQNIKIYPWNFNEIIDKDQTAEEFIKRLRNKGTYFQDEDVLPKKSLLYQEYMTLNELNNIRVKFKTLDNEKHICLENKEKIINEIFKKKKSVSKKAIENFLITEGQTYESSRGYGNGNKFAASLSSYIDFTKILGEVTPDNSLMIEEIIYWLTVFNDREIIETRIKRKYGDRISEEQVGKILNLNYSGWGALSRKLLDGILSKNENPQERATVIQTMRNSHKNLMQVLNHDKLGFKEIIEEEGRQKRTGKLKYKDVDELVTSPANKKGIWQSIRIIEEIVKIKGCHPAKIYLEIARGKDKNPKRTTSRYDRVKEHLKQLADTGLINEFNNISKDDMSSDRLLLYFLQQGKCMYTGEVLDINQLSSYHIDHILPQAYIKDDSLSNRVLVKRTANMRKNDDLTIRQEIQTSRAGLWKHLLEKQMITLKKFNLLMKDKITEGDRKGFINRQLVETRQITKRVKDLLEGTYTDTKVRSIKAGLISKCRSYNHFYKIRDLNHFHHAHDAYLACLVGQYVDIRFPNWAYQKAYSERYRNHVRKMAEQEGQSGKSYDYFIGSLKTRIIDNTTGEIKWDGEKRLAKARKILQYKDVLVSKKKEEQSGQFYNQTIYPKGSSEAKIPLKKGMDPGKYGGYSGEMQAYCVLIESDQGKKRKREFVGIPVQRAYLIRDGKLTLDTFLNEELGYKDKNLEIIIEKIPKYQLFEGKDGGLFFIISSKEVANAKELVLDEKYQKLLYAMTFKNPKQDCVNDSALVELFGRFIEKIDQHYACFTGVNKKLKKALDEGIFASLPLKYIDPKTKAHKDKITVIKQLLLMTQANSSNANLKLIGGTEREGRLKRKPFSFVDDDGRITLINRSVTGLFESHRKV